jgi:outer membrane protein assembly factor BamD
MRAGLRVKTRIIILMIIMLFCIVGCQLTFFKKDEMVKGTPEGLYSRGALEYQKGNYKKAREYFTRLREEHPLNDLAVLADMGIADSCFSDIGYFNDKGYMEAEIAYTDFINLHPTNENVPYAIYQLGMCHYNQIEAIDRDQTETVKARKEFEKLVARYPESKFAILAEKLIRECKQKQAEHEFYVGKFYFTQKKYQAALTRLETVARDYASVGLDYKVEYLISETKVKIAEEEKLKKDEEAKEKAKEEKKKAQEEQKKAKEEQKAASKQ